MAQIIKIRDSVPIYGECSCGCDTFLLHLNDDDPPEVIALECAGCRGVIEFEEYIAFEPD